MFNKLARGRIVGALRHDIAQHTHAKYLHSGMLNCIHVNSTVCEMSSARSGWRAILCECVHGGAWPHIKNGTRDSTKW